jgi:hypothetical protein
VGAVTAPGRCLRAGIVPRRHDRRARHSVASPPQHPRRGRRCAGRARRCPCLPGRSATSACSCRGPDPTVTQRVVPPRWCPASRAGLVRQRQPRTPGQSCRFGGRSGVATPLRRERPQNEGLERRVGVGHAAGAACEAEHRTVDVVNVHVLEAVARWLTSQRPVVRVCVRRDRYAARAR